MRTQTTAECTVWPMIHDSFAKHTLAWVPELRNALHARSSSEPRQLNFELAREPWRGHIAASQVVDLQPYKDSPLWFCAANRANWDYEYGWFSGRGVRVTALRPQALLASADDKLDLAKPGTTAQPGGAGEGFCLGRDYPFPMVLPVVPSVDYSELPMLHCWAGRWATKSAGETAAEFEPISAAARAAVRDAVVQAAP